MDSHNGRAYFQATGRLFHFSGPANERKPPFLLDIILVLISIFWGCYYHEGIFLASYNRRLLVETVERQQTYPAHVIPELTDLIRKKGKRGAMNLFIKSAPLHLRVQMNDSTEWRMKNQWLAMDLFYNEGSLCCFNEQPYEKALENFYPNLCDTITTRINRLFPQIKTTTRTSRGRPWSILQFLRELSSSLFFLESCHKHIFYE